MKKIVVLGPESTGKSTLCEQLAEHYQSRWCPEYAREYLLKNGTGYTFDDLLTIAKGQLDLEQKITAEHLKSSSELLPSHSRHTAQDSRFFIDTDQYVMKVWCEYVFGDSHTWILNRIAEQSYDLYLLCKPDLPWVQDELREYPNEKPRQELYHIYKDIMITQNVPWVEISGSYEERLKKAVATVENL